MGKMRATHRRSVYRAAIYHLRFIRSITSCDRKDCFTITACDTAHGECTILWNPEAEFSRFAVIHLLGARVVRLLEAKDKVVALARPKRKG